MKRCGKLAIPDDQYNFLWVEDFPLFSYESSHENEEKRIVTTHHPFTAPHPDDIDLLMSSTIAKDLLRVRYVFFSLSHTLTLWISTNGHFIGLEQRPSLRLCSEWC